MAALSYNRHESKSHDPIQSKTIIPDLNNTTHDGQQCTVFVRRIFAPSKFWVARDHCMNVLAMMTLETGCMQAIHQDQLQSAKTKTKTAILPSAVLCTVFYERICNFIHQCSPRHLLRRNPPPEMKIPPSCRRRQENLFNFNNRLQASER